MKPGSSFAIGLFYPLIVLAAVVLLAAVQLRSSSGAAFDTWRLNHNANRALDEKLQAKLTDLREKVTRNQDDMSFTKQCLSFFDSDGNVKATVIDPGLLEEFREAKKAGKRSGDYFGEMRCLLRGYVSLVTDVSYLRSSAEWLGKDLIETIKALEQTGEQYRELIKGKQDFLAFKEMENFWYSSLISVTPYDLLVLLLVMFMGLLGGMVRLLRDYGDTTKQNPRASDYFFVPMIGLVVAIGGYVLAKTGLLLLSSSRDEHSLSPFMVGLVGIVSGLLAREVIEAIERAGRKLFGSQSQQQPPPAPPAPPPVAPAAHAGP